MKCAECQDLIQQRLDGLEPSNSSEVELHLRECPACRALQAAACRLHQGLRLLTPPLPSAGLGLRIASLLQAEQKSQLRWRRRMRLGLAAAAAVLLLVSAWLIRFAAPTRPGVPRDEPNQLAGKPAEPETPTPAEQAFDLRESVSEVGSAMVSAATRTTDAALEQSRAFLPLVPSAPMPTLNVPAPMEPTRSLKEAGQGVSDGLAPVADSARRAIDLFLRDLPPVELEGKTGF